MNRSQIFCRRFKNISVDSEVDFRMFPRKGRAFQETNDLQQSHQVIRCLYFVTIVTFGGHKFQLKTRQTNAIRKLFENRLP